MLKEGRRRRRLLFFLIQFYRCLPRGWKRTGPVPLARDLLKRSRIERNTNKRKVKLRRRSSKWTNMNSTRCTNDFPRWKMKALLLPCRPVPPILIYLAQHLIFFLKHFASLYIPHPYCPPLFPLITLFPFVDTRHFSTVSRLCKLVSLRPPPLNKFSKRILDHQYLIFGSGSFFRGMNSWEWKGYLIKEFFLEKERIEYFSLLVFFFKHK